jgi:hypothetical protein
VDSLAGLAEPAETAFLTAGRSPRPAQNRLNGLGVCGKTEIVRKKQQSEQRTTKLNLRSFGCGLHRKPRIFPKPVKQPTEHAPNRARLGVLV